MEVSFLLLLNALRHKLLKRTALGGRVKVSGSLVQSRYREHCLSCPFIHSQVGGADVVQRLTISQAGGVRLILLPPSF